MEIAILTLTLCVVVYSLVSAVLQAKRPFNYLPLGDDFGYYEMLVYEGILLSERLIAAANQPIRAAFEANHRLNHWDKRIQKNTRFTLVK